MTLVEYDGKMMTPQEKNIYIAKIIEKEFGSCFPDESKMTKEQRDRYIDLFYEMNEC